MTRELIDRVRQEGGFTLVELMAVVVIIGILAAIAIPNYIGQQDKAIDAAAMAQLRTAATSQQLYYVEQNAYAGTATELEAYGFRQGEQEVTVMAADTSSYCMEAPRSGSPRIRAGHWRADARNASARDAKSTCKCACAPAVIGCFRGRMALACDIR
jgi:type IV pilus assembly protein PilA